MLKSGDRISVAIQNALVSLAAYLVGYYFTASFHGKSSSIGGLWSLVSGIVVLQATSRDTWKSAVLRVLGTLIGAMLSGFYLYLFPFSPVGMAVSRRAYCFVVPDGRSTRSRSFGRHHCGASHGDFERQSRVVSVRKCGTALHRIGYRCWDIGVGGPALAQGQRGHVTNSHLSLGSTSTSGVRSCTKGADSHSKCART